MTETAPVFNFNIIDPSALRVSRLMQVDLHRLEEWRQGLRPLSRAKRGRLRLLEAIYAGEDMSPGVRIRRIRQGLKVGQAKIGAWVGATQHMISEWERGWDFPTDDQIAEIVAQARRHVEEQAEAFARQPDGPVLGPHQEEAAKVKHLRHYLGLHTKELAAQLGVAASTVERWERGIMKPRQANWNKMSDLRMKSAITTQSKIVMERRSLQTEPIPFTPPEPQAVNPTTPLRVIWLVMGLLVGAGGGWIIHGFGYAHGWW